MGALNESNHYKKIDVHTAEGETWHVNSDSGSDHFAARASNPKTPMHMCWKCECESPLPATGKIVTMSEIVVLRLHGWALTNQHYDDERGHRTYHVATWCPQCEGER